MNQDSPTLYRFDGKVGPFTGSTRIVETEFVVVGQTDRSYWIVAKKSKYWWDFHKDLPHKERVKRCGARCVLKRPLNRAYAYTDRDRAWRSFVNRAARRREHLRRQTKNAASIWAQIEERDPNLAESWKPVAEGTPIPADTHDEN